MNESGNIYKFQPKKAESDPVLQGPYDDQIDYRDPLALVHISIGRRAAFREAAAITKSLTKFADREGVKAVYESLAAVFLEMGKK